MLMNANEGYISLLGKHGSCTKTVQRLIRCISSYKSEIPIKTQI